MTGLRTGVPRTDAIPFGGHAPNGSVGRPGFPAPGKLAYTFCADLLGSRVENVGQLLDPVDPISGEIAPDRRVLPEMERSLGVAKESVRNIVNSEAAKPGRYKVLVAGYNCLRNVDGLTAKYGFFTTRFVEGRSADIAGKSALHLVSVELQGYLSNLPSDPPSLEVERVEAVSSFAGVSSPGGGFTWYAEQAQ